LGIVEIIVILVVALIVIPPDNLPDVMRATGKVLRELRLASNMVMREIGGALDQQPPPRSEPPPINMMKPGPVATSDNIAQSTAPADPVKPADSAKPADHSTASSVTPSSVTPAPADAPESPTIAAESVDAPPTPITHS
jgi:sec-independent protein translocase protein TatB